MFLCFAFMLRAFFSDAFQTTKNVSHAHIHDHYNNNAADRTIFQQITVTFSIELLCDQIRYSVPETEFMNFMVFQKEPTTKCS